ncbi:inner membrane complex protein 1e, putative, partial [Hepatocystis sp. ex Piliocolobus tephrosceles]
RNIVSPQYRHIPKPVEVPMAHYRTFPVEKLVDRNVPVPVELQIIQEFLCPKIEARYKEIPVPVHVQRIIEHPVPKQAMNNPLLLPLYYKESNIHPGTNINSGSVSGGIANDGSANGNTTECFLPFNCNKNSMTQQNGQGVSSPIELLLHNDNNIKNMHNNNNNNYIDGNNNVEYMNNYNLNNNFQNKNNDLIYNNMGNINGNNQYPMQQTPINVSDINSYYSKLNPQLSNLNQQELSQMHLQGTNMNFPTKVINSQIPNINRQMSNLSQKGYTMNTSYYGSNELLKKQNAKSYANLVNTSNSNSDYNQSYSTNLTKDNSIQE